MWLEPVLNAISLGSKTTIVKRFLPLSLHD